MKPVVIRSINDAEAQRCVDIVQTGALFSWVECRRDPEDAHGWRRLTPPFGAFESLQDALADARAQIGWLDG